MNSWPVKPLGDVCEVNPRLRPDELAAADYEVSFVPMAAVDEVFGEIVRPEARPYSEAAKGFTSFKDGDVLFAKITPCMENGKAVIARNLTGGLGFGSTEFHVLRPSHEVIAEWIFSFVRQPSFRALAKSNFTGTAGQRRVPTDFMKSVLVPVPPLAEQERIVKLLDEADALRKLRAEADRRTAELIPALFYEMFGDPVRNEKGWEVIAIGDMADVQGGLQLSSRRDSLDLRMPYLRVANVQRGFLALDEIKTIGLTVEELNRTRLRQGDLLIVEGNGSPREIGRSALWNSSIDDCVHQNHLIRVRPKQELLMPEVLLAFLNSDLGRDYFWRAGNSTSGLVTISTRIVKECRIPLPPAAIQAGFKEQERAIRSLLMGQQQRAKSEKQDLIQSITQRAFANE